MINVTVAPEKPFNFGPHQTLVHLARKKIVVVAVMMVLQVEVAMKKMVCSMELK